MGTSELMVSIESIMEPQICASSVVKVGVKGPSVEDLANTSRRSSCVRSRRARCEDSIMVRNLRACASVLVRSGYTLKALVGSDLNKCIKLGCLASI